MCANDEGNRSLQPGVKPIMPTAGGNEGVFGGGNQQQQQPKYNSFQNNNFKQTDPSKIQKNADDTYTFTLDNGAVYRGKMNGTMREGYGVQKWSDGSVYEGIWKEDKACGKGKLIHADGDVYEGDWRDDKANGTGVYTHSNGSR